MSTTSSPGCTPASATIRAAHSSTSACQPHARRDRTEADTTHHHEGRHGANVGTWGAGGNRITPSPVYAWRPLSSIAAFAGGGDAYSAAKAAIIGWTLDLAVRLGPDGVRINAVVPGYVTDTEFFGDRMTAQRHQRLVARTLLGRAGTPQDVAGTVAFLASDDAASITGQLLHVNGGALLGR